MYMYKGLTFTVFLSCYAMYDSSCLTAVTFCWVLGVLSRDYHALVWGSGGSILRLLCSMFGYWVLFCMDIYLCWVLGVLSMDICLCLDCWMLCFNKSTPIMSPDPTGMLTSISVGTCKLSGGVIFMSQLWYWAFLSRGQGSLLLFLGYYSYPGRQLAPASGM
jgi:hypothetical protein